MDNRATVHYTLIIDKILKMALSLAERIVIKNWLYITWLLKKRIRFTSMFLNIFEQFYFYSQNFTFIPNFKKYIFVRIKNLLCILKSK